MKVLVACEFSGIVRDAFLARGHDAWSCDILPTESPGPHYQCDVIEILGRGWDLMVGHPPCTYLSYAGIGHWNKPGRKELREDAMMFFIRLMDAPIPKICIENPVGYPSNVFRKPDQIIHPYYFGDGYMKRTCLWLKGLPHLVWSDEDDLLFRKTTTKKPEAIYVQKHGKQIGKKRHFIDAMPGGKDRQKARSKFFPGIAKAMAEQWG